MEILKQLGPAQRHAGGLHALHVRMEPGAAMDGHRHDEPSIVIISRGDVHVTEGDDEVHEVAGTLRLSPAHLSRSLRSPAGADCLIISCNPSHAIARHTIWRRLSATRSTRFRAGLKGETLVQQVGNPASSVPEFESLCMDLLTTLVRDSEATHPPPPWLGRALFALGETAGRKGACAEVARDLRIHPVHLARVVRRFTGLTLRDYLRHERIIHGSRMLRTSGKSLTRLAHEAGFADHSHFTREFVHRYGDVPSEDRLKATPDVVSIQASEFPAVHLGCLMSDDTARSGCPPSIPRSSYHRWTPSDSDCLGSVNQDGSRQWLPHARIARDFFCSSPHQPLVSERKACGASCEGMMSARQIIRCLTRSGSWIR